MLLKRIGNVWRNYLVGQFLVTLFVSVAVWGAGALTGLRYPVINGVTAGICESIPNIGPVISGIISGADALIFGSSHLDIPNWQFAILIVLCVILIQILQNWLISPLIIGKKMDLHPLLVFAGMIVFSMLFGFWGMILSVPIMGTIREIYRYRKETKAGDHLQKDELQLPPHTEK